MRDLHSFPKAEINETLCCACCGKNYDEIYESEIHNPNCEWFKIYRDLETLYTMKAYDYYVDDRIKEVTAVLDQIFSTNNEW